MKKCGWIKSIRKSKSLTFMSVTDGQQDYQCTITEDAKIIGDIKVGSSFEAIGIDSLTPRGLYEFLIADIKIIGSANDSYPIQPKQHSYDFLRTILEHRGRTKNFQTIWQIRHLLSKALHQSLDELSYLQYFTPIITMADCEGAGQTFDVKADWLEEKLTVSGQLQLEVGCMSLGKVYTFGPCFRAEKSATKKHLSEFWMLECETAFSDLEESMQLTEHLIKKTIKQALSRIDLFQKLDISIQHLEDVLKIWPRITYDEICQKYDLEYGHDIGSELEQKIIKDYQGPVFITMWPTELKPFYMLKEGGKTHCFDLIFPMIGELVGGSAREADYDILKTEMQMAGLDMQKMQWYLDIRKYGSVPHSGFGLGFERLLMFVCQLQKIQDAIPFPVSF